MVNVYESQEHYDNTLEQFEKLVRESRGFNSVARIEWLREANNILRKEIIDSQQQ